MLRLPSVVALWLSLGVIVQGADVGRKNQGAAAVEAKLEERTEVQYLDTTLEDVMNDIKLRHRLEMRCDWNDAMAATGRPAEDIHVTVSLKDLSLASALANVLAPLGLTWAVDNDVLVITSLEKEPSYLVTKVYKVGDFASDLGSLQNVLETSIEINSWRTNGGNVGAIARSEDAKMLIVTHTARTQRRVAQLIDTLRAAKAEVKQ